MKAPPVDLRGIKPAFLTLKPCDTSLNIFLHNPVRNDASQILRTESIISDSVTCLGGVPFYLWWCCMSKASVEAS